MVDKTQLLIGENIQIIKAKNRMHEGMEGRVVDETKNSFVIRTTQGDKRVLKEQITFTIIKKIIQGKYLTKRLEDRIKIRR